MKTLTLLLLQLLLALNVSAQLYISTNSRTEFVWDELNSEWEFEGQDDESSTFFEFNEDFTLVKHTTATLTSTYIIKSVEYDDSNDSDQYLFEVISDVGNKYIMIHDLKGDNIRFIANDGKRLVRFSIKSAWKDE